MQVLLGSSISRLYNTAMITLSNDGSQTVFSEQFNEHYHSIHGAYTEAMHVFINAGLDLFSDKENLTIFEMGFGTGLNAFLTLQHKSPTQNIIYHSIDLYPLKKDLYTQLNYGQSNELQNLFIQQFHDSHWNTELKINENFYLSKIHNDILNYPLTAQYDLVYFDAFSPRHQENCWSKALFEKIFHHMTKGAILVTYCAKGSIKRLLTQIGFRIETLQGPPGKREMIRAHK
jgi:tRNA U34 5-methylaminomethyl-2-thiouridine-forming methyltransferase MnmC